MEGDTTLLGYIVLEAGLLIGLTSGYLFFIASSVGLTRSRISRLEELADQGVTSATRGLAALKHSDSFLLCAQTGRFMSALLSGIVLSHLLRSVIMESVLRGVSSPFSYLTCIAIIVMYALITLIFVQVIKGATLHHPERVLCLLSAPLTLAHLFMGPAINYLHKWIVAVLSHLGFKPMHERQFTMNADDFSELAKSSNEKGDLGSEGREVIERLAGFSDTLVREVMTPRQDIVSIRVTDSLEEVITVLSRERLSRLLVTGNEIDDVRGIVLAKDLIHLIGRNVEGLQPASFIRPAHFVPNTRKVEDLFHELRREAKHFAVVLDEHGSVDGVVTVEDLLEELVGEIFDEYDSPTEEAGVERLPSGELLMNGGYLLDDLNTSWNLHLPSGDYDTVAGLILAKLGRIPARGEEIRINGVTLFVEELSRNRIKRVRLKSHHEAGNPETFDGNPSTERISQNS